MRYVAQCRHNEAMWCSQGEDEVVAVESEDVRRGGHCNGNGRDACADGGCMCIRLVWMVFAPTGSHVFERRGCSREVMLMVVGRAKRVSKCM